MSADVTADMTDRFEIEIDTTAANEKWHVEVEENLKRQAEETEGQPTRLVMAPRDEAPDVDQLARSMLRLYGAHDDDDEHDTTVTLGFVLRHRISLRIPTVPPRCGKPRSVTASDT